jgi:hypothetical protein
MMVYQPRNPTSYEFHQSTAFIRYFRAGNRTSKTQSGYAEHYFCVTGHHPYRKMPAWPASTLLVCGLPFTDYTPKVFEKKMLSGEDGPELGKNPLSPMFPEEGKWFYHYDKKNHIITLACPECANRGCAQRCPGNHKKTTIGLVSGEKGKDVVEAFSVRLAHIDEHVPEEFLSAIKMRVADQEGASIVITGTPLHGPDAWEAQQLTKVANRDPKYNRADPEDPESPPYVSLHHCSKWAGNIVSHKAIRTEMQGMDKYEIDARIEGKPAALAKNPVFDRSTLAEMEKACYPPVRGRLESPVALIDTSEQTKMAFEELDTADLRVWEEPVEGEQYIVCVDTAAGLIRPTEKSSGDPSCASVVKLGQVNGKLTFKQVAQYHGWLGIHEYTDEVFKLAVWYNSALVVVELTGGFGRAVVERLKKTLFYWNIFRDTSKGEYADFFQDGRFGIDTSAHNKPSMIAVLQQVIKDERLVVYCLETIKELVAYEQERTDLGNPRYRGAGGTHDDRVMALVVGIAVAVSHALYDVTEELKQHDAAAKAEPYTEEWQEIHKEMKAKEYESWD